MPPAADIPAEVIERARRIRLMVFDVDGVLTDGRLHFGADGREHKEFHVHDGLGLKLLRAAGIEVAVLTARTSPIVASRMAELGIDHVYQGQEAKLACFERLVAALRLDNADVGFMGDDLPDLAVMRRVGLAIAPANATDAVLAAAHWRTCRAGGNGAAREACELLLSAQDKLTALLAGYTG
ncbi:MAG TPA: HAD hydrolase family protein [Xanthomonadaceae bacterium]|nr:HAD hydrolase family protein [Xanthomonadaceae bacterium]